MREMSCRGNQRTEKKESQVPDRKIAKPKDQRDLEEIKTVEERKPEKIEAS